MDLREGFDLGAVSRIRKAVPRGRAGELQLLAVETETIAIGRGELQSDAAGSAILLKGLVTARDDGDTGQLPADSHDAVTDMTVVVECELRSEIPYTWRRPQ